MGYTKRTGMTCRDWAESNAKCAGLLARLDQYADAGRAYGHALVEADRAEAWDRWVRDERGAYALLDATKTMRPAPRP